MARKAEKKRKYSRSSGKDVESEMRRYKKGTAKSGRGGWQSQKPQAGRCHRSVEGPEERQEGAKEEEETVNVAVRLVHF